MKHILLNKTASLLLLIPLPCFAGHEVGNGGNAIVCRDPGRTILSAELLDFYEARTLRGIDRSLGGPEIPVEDKLESVFKDLDRLSPHRGESYRDLAHHFSRDSRFVHGVELEPIPDSAHMTVPYGCKVEQLAIQKQPEFPEDRLYTVNGDIWDKLDNDSRTGLILHEIIYREALDYGQQTSIETRYFNSVLTSARRMEMTLEKFVELLKQVHFQRTDIQGWLYFTSDLEFYPGTDQLHKGRLMGTENMPRYQVLMGLSAPENDFMPLGMRWLQIHNEIEFSPAGRPTVLTLSEPQPLMIQNEHVAAKNKLTLYEDRAIDTVELSCMNPRLSFASDSRKYSVLTDYQDLDACKSEGDLLSFYNDGYLKSCKRCSGHALSHGLTLDLEKEIALFSDGTVASGTLIHSTDFPLQGRPVAFAAHSKLAMDDESHELSEGTLRDQTTLAIGGKKIELISTIWLKNGAIITGSLAQDTSLIDQASGLQMVFRAGKTLDFDGQCRARESWDH